MNPFEKIFPINKEKKESVVEKKPESTVNDYGIKNTHDFMQAIYEDHLDEAESYLLREKNQASQSGHDEHWLYNKLRILLQKYIDKKDAPAVERINRLLPDHYQRNIVE